MPITLNCPKCHKPFRVRDESVGGKVRCPTAACGAVLQVPSSLAPVSNMGFDVPQDQDPAEMSNIHRPMADDVSSVAIGSMDDLMLGGAGRRTTGGAFNPAETALPAPPSIKMRGPSPVAPMPAKKPDMVPPANVFQTAPPVPMPSKPVSQPQLLPPAPQPTLRPVSMPQTHLQPVPMQDDGCTGWRKVCGGLRFVQLGLLLLTVPLLAALGHAVWAAMNVEAALPTGPGMLKLDGINAWQEWLLLYTGVPATLGLLLLFFGRLKCGRVPVEAHARSLIQVATLCTLVAAFAGFLVVVANVPALASKANLPANAGRTALFLYVPTALLADLCTLFFFGQLGWAVGRPTLFKSIAWLCGFALLAPAVLAIVNLYYPLVGPVQASLAAGANPLAGGLSDDLARRTLVLVGGVALIVVAILVRYAGIAGSARRAVRQHLGE